jgi:putative cell wall-binding protein
VTTQQIYIPRGSSSTTVAVLAPLVESRLFGSDRFATSAAISAATFAPGVPVVYIANGLDFPDALSGAAAAGTNGAPVLLIEATTIPAPITAELTRLHPARIVVLGGTGAVSETLKTTLATYTSGTVTRLFGSDRFATSAAISAATFTPGVPVVYIANGLNFPDALSGAAAAGTNGAPVLLIEATTIPAPITAELTRLHPARIVVLGGTGAVSETVKTTLATYTSGTVTRLFGSDRFATSAAISAATFTAGVPVVYIANGLNFPDALSGAAAAGTNGAPVLLVESNGITADIRTELQRLNPASIVVLGGQGSVSTLLEQGLRTVLQPG